MASDNPWDLLSDDLAEIRKLVEDEARSDKGGAPARVGHAAPRTPTEKALAAVFAQLLGVERVGIDEDFFALGGHSILATQVIAQVRSSLRVEAPLDWIIEEPTVEGLARRVDTALLEGHLSPEESDPLPRVTIAPEAAHEPFDLTDIQQAYWLGRGKEFELGNISTHVYMEFEAVNLDIGKLESAWQALIARHDLLRLNIDPAGRQRVLKEVPRYQIAAADLRSMTPEQTAQRLDATRAELSHQVFDVGRWPMFDIRADLLAEGKIRTHFSIDFLAVDAGSLGVLFREWEQLYRNPAAELPKLELTFRDYAAAAAKVRQTALYQRSQDYWWKRLSSLPAAPQLPTVKSARSLVESRFVRRTQRLDAAAFGQLKKQAAIDEVTPSTLLATAFGEVLANWSRSPRFTLNLTLFNRLPLHPQVDAVVGDFTSLTLLQMEFPANEDFKTRARRVQKQLWADLDHRYVSGVEVLREISRRQQSVAMMPVVFTSTLGLSVPMSGESPLLGKEIYSISQTPQVSLDHQIFEEPNGGLRYTWDSVEELFPAGMLDEMFAAYHQRLQEVAGDRAGSESSWLPAHQRASYAEWNQTAGAIPTGLLQAGLMEQARLRPDAVAIIAPDRTLTYRELASEARRLGRRLRELAVKPDELVAIVMERGWEQVVAVVGVLESGAAYLPIDADLPPERRFHLVERCGVRVVLTQPRIDEAGPWPEGPLRIRVVANGFEQLSDAPLVPAQRETNLAYVLFTSGSTGVPKGVMIEHRGALNTIVDINERHSIKPDDRVLSLSSLSFDLSVYDIFGVLAAGGALVLIAPGDTREPGRWVELIEQHRVTLWNSVPALMQMMLNHQEELGSAPLKSLRLALWSGDWVPLNLADRLRAMVPGVRAVSMGGATEASIWSIDHPIEKLDPAWASIPYGKPMKNQSWCVLGEDLLERPWWVPGELYIAGIGLARGYWNDEEKTKERFIQHPKTGERLYRTGDWGRYHADGNIEFLGREDGQVKIRGFRVELGEIDAALSALPEAREALCIAYLDASGQKSLAAYVALKEGARLDAAAVKAKLAARLPDYMVPSQVFFLPALPLSSNGKIDRKALPSPIARGTGAAYEAPRTEREEKLAALWQDLLQKERVGISDNFFQLGGNSLVAVNLVTRAQREFGIAIPLAAVLVHPTIEGLLGSLEPSTSQPKLRNLLTLTEGGSRPPVVLVAGLGGYAFVFQGLAQHLGKEQPLHVLNAIGAADESEGLHHSIEEMAAIYEPQILAACPQGPIIVGGYSFGMVVAFEIARRLRALGRSVPLLVSFDGFAPCFPKMLPLPQRLAAHARAFISADSRGRRGYLRGRMLQLKSRFNKLLGKPEDSAEAVPFADPETDLRLRKVGAALWEAGLNYRPDYLAPCDLVLVKSSVPERWIGADMDDPIYGWRSWVSGRIETAVVPGEHLTLFEASNQPQIAKAVARAIENLRA